ncbi:MAG TPA: AraC family transcriptional regulator [Nitrospiraceae bacterium]|nr:AraC family transcriptional regulator [Nitrospiraceae bacterium]
MDALSDLLQTVKLTGGMFLEAHFTAPWCISSGIGSEDCRPFLSDPMQVIAYHYVTRGRMLVQVAGNEPVEVRAGEAVLLPQNDPHLLGSSIGVHPVNSHDLIQRTDGGGLARIIHGGSGEVTQIVCGFLGSDRHRNPLIATLPRLLTIDMTRTGSDEWIETSLRFAIRGLNDGLIGTSPVMSKLSEVMFVEAVRGYAAALPAEQRGWLAGVRDPYVSRALALMHDKPNHPWTTASLAGQVSLSRSAFADRFTAVVGVPPKRYLISWRLQVAKEKLRAGRQPVAQIAYDVGYEAEAAFTRAFKREFGVPPVAWRRQTQVTEV